MRRDLRRDLEVLDRLSVPDLLEDAERRALGPDRGSALGPSPSRPRLLTSLLTVAVVGLAVAGFVWLSSAFRATPAPPANSTEPSYVFTNVRPDPDEEGMRIRFEVIWSTEISPGLRRCRFQALGLNGNVVSELGRDIAFGPADSVWIDVPPPTDAVGSARVVCDPERLDTPGIVDVVPLDPADVGLDPDRWVEALERRVDGWAARFVIDSMTAEQLAWNIEALSSYAITGQFPGDAQAWAWQEWHMRIARLCVLLTEGHELRTKDCLGAGPAS
jgi:hypothetical protein